jgi:hypothetical protein
VLECPPPLVKLFATCPGVDRVVAEGEVLPAFEVQAPLLSLPAVFGTTLQTVPAAVPYLAAEPAREGRWRRRLEGGGFQVGVVWQGNPRHPWDRWRSLPLSMLAPLAAVEGVRLESLQKGPGTEQLRALQGPLAVMDLGDELDAEGDFLDTAAVLQTLDLLISVDTATAHVAGALGVPVWLALAAVADWRWGWSRLDTPWYPSMRLFRQEFLGQWDEVLNEMVGQLRHMVSLGTLGARERPMPRTAEQMGLSHAATPGADSC